MQIFNRRVICVVLALCWAGSAAAQSSEEEDLALSYGDNSTVSIATGSKQVISRAPSSATVITSQDIKAMGATDLDQALESVPGLHVSSNSIVSKPIYSFRGIHTSQNPQVLMLVNGLPVTNVFAGDRSQIWGGMPLENVARIEVIRGPGSALYGADAFSGVINIITKTAADIQGTEYGVRAGSYNTKDAWIQHGGKLGALDAAFYLNAGDTDGQKGIILKDAASASGPVNAQNKSLDAHADLSYQAWRLRSTYQQRELGSGAGLAGALDPAARVSESRFYLDTSYEKTDWARNLDLSAVAGFYNIKQDQANPYFTLFPAGVIPGFPNGMIGNPGHAEQHGNASVSAFYKGLEQHQVRIGAGFRADDLYSTQEVKNFGPTFAPLPQGLVDASGNPALVYLLPHNRNVSFAFAQDEYNFANDWTLTAGVRHDNYSDFGGTTNPRLALVWDAAYNLVVKAMHATAFRAPSFTELYAINNPVTIGTPGLQPETITTNEFGFAWQPLKKLKTSLNFFRYHMHNIILPVGTAYQNSGGQTGRGFEFEATFDADYNLRLTGNLSVQHSTDDVTGLDAGMAPHQHLFARADWRFMPLWQLGTTVNSIKGRMREPYDTRPQIPDYTTVDLNLRREELVNNWEISAKVMNLFNADAREPTFKATGIYSDLPLPGRTVYLQLQHSL